MYPPEPYPPEPREPGRGEASARRLVRFTRAERSVHHVTGLLMLVCLVTAALLYFPFLTTFVGRREMVKTVHVWCGFALPAPIVLGLLSRAFRADVRRLNRFAPHDWEWLRRRDRRDVRGGRGILPVGKFNAGQKLNASFTLGAILIMLATGEILTFPGPWPDAWRTGATFVHDWLFLIVLVVTAGHLWMAFGDREALTGMRTGRVDAGWARRHHAGWADAAGARAGRAGDAHGAEHEEAGPEFAERPPGMP
ncbi:cytochrome b/b6 domain-containing protein [Actinomadura rifamycini]|uniref:cytochrome b/b6 domain-containing protein n=1 Tax=Actinomadura rifamycini TaxID=31962 RepID=UPI0003FF383C|nr:cytochrome b/b6 domain-containing protein [Actinomadura rifamycini]